MENGASSYRRFLDGDDQSFLEIIRDYKDGLIFYLDSFTRNIHTAEELMEETFVRLVIKKPKYVESASFKTWLYTIARHVAVDWIRKNSRFGLVPLDEVANYLPDEADLEREYLREERKIALHRAMRKLNPDYAQVLWLAFFEELSNGEIAAVMNKTKRQIEKMLYRAKQALKTELNKEGIYCEEL
jgi:RNA polymerase sigma-70 factor (ECF subfamily)